MAAVDLFTARFFAPKKPTPAAKPAPFLPGLAAYQRLRRLALKHRRCLYLMRQNVIGTPRACVLAILQQQAADSLAAAIAARRAVYSPEGTDP